MFKNRLAMIGTALLGVVGVAAAQSSSGTWDNGTALSATYAPAAQSLATGLETNFVNLMPIVGTLLVVIWGPRIAKDLIKHFTH